MRQLLRLWQYSLFLVCGGAICIAFVLFLQPFDPAQFLSAAFNFSLPAKMPNASLAILLFWAALLSCILGLSGALWSLAKKHSYKKEAFTQSADYGRSDQGEENWIFI